MMTSDYPEEVQHDKQNYIFQTFTGFQYFPWQGHICKRPKLAPIDPIEITTNNYPKEVQYDKQKYIIFQAVTGFQYFCWQGHIFVEQ